MATLTGTTAAVAQANEYNLALNRAATGSAPCVASEGPEKAVNGSVSGGLSDKWCSSEGATKTLEIDLGEGYRLRSLVVRHAGAGGESADLNTRNFGIEVTSAAGRSNGAWFKVAGATNNADPVTYHNFTRGDIMLQWVRFTTTDPVARIYELEAFTSSI
jgi:mannosyl-glycoprotein endo-beta-N-acetylglucosaminidase